MNIQINLFFHLQFSSDMILYPQFIGAYADGFAVLSRAGTNTAKPSG